MLKKHGHVLFLIRTVIFLILCCEAVRAGTGFSDPQFMTLQQAIEKALQTSPTFLRSKNQMESAELESKNTFTNFFPSVDLSASHGIRGIQPDRSGLTTRTPLVSTATLSLTENIYDNGESFKKNKIAEYKLQLAKLNYEKIKAQMIRSVVLAYYQYNIAVQNLKFISKNFDELERFSSLLKNLFHQGLKTEKDYLGFKTRAQRSRLDVIRAEQILSEARTTLLKEIGISPDEMVRFDETVKPVVSKKELDVEFRTESLYEYRGLDLQNKIGELEVSLAERRLWPEVSLVAAGSYGSSDYINNQRWSDSETTQWSMLLNLKFNLVDWGTRSRNIQIAKYSQSSEQQSAQNSLLQALKELQFVFEKKFRIMLCPIVLCLVGLLKFVYVLRQTSSCLCCRVMDQLMCQMMMSRILFIRSSMLPLT